MDWMYLFYFSLALLMFFGACGAGSGAWNEEYTSLKQTKALQGIMILGVALHHMAQKTCASWLSHSYIVNGLNFFLPMGYMFVAVFLFCSGLGLYKSLQTKPDYLKGFFRRRILPIVIAFYLSEWIWTAVRLLTGQQMNPAKILWYLSGLGMANDYSWYVIVIPFFYLVFHAAFRFCRREGVAILWIFAFTLAYTVLGCLVGQQDTWWMRGQWWYNSILLFPLGILFGKYEKQVTGFFKKGYWFWLILSFAAIFALHTWSEYMLDHGWGYYGRWQSRLPAAATQWLVSIAYVAFCFLLMMKVKLGNRALAWLGGMTLEFYLMHGLFVQLFGFSFLDVGRSLIYIRSVPLYTVAVLGASVPASVLFRCLCRSAMRPVAEFGLSREEKAAARRKREKDRAKLKEKLASRTRILRMVIFPALLIALAVMIIVFRPDSSERTYGGILIKPPEGYSKTFSDSRYSTWKYTGTDRKPGILVFDGEIRGELSQGFASAEAVLRDCDWMTEAEPYINPQEIRMARGYSTEFSGYPERRYYVESDNGVFLLSMIEDRRYYDPEDCENAMQQTADALCRK